MASSKSACAICLENQSIHVKCPHCKDGTYCKSCIIKLIKENNHEKCPICRRDGWYERNTKINSLITKHHVTTHANDAHESESTVCKALTKIIVYSIVLSMVTFVRLGHPLRNLRLSYINNLFKLLYSKSQNNDVTISRSGSFTHTWSR